MAKNPKLLEMEDFSWSCVEIYGERGSGYLRSNQVYALELLEFRKGTFGRTGSGRHVLAEGEGRIAVSASATEIDE